MARSLEKLPDEPIILETLHADYSMAELAAGRTEGQSLMDAQTQPVVWIADMSAAPVSFVEEFLDMLSKLSATGKSIPQHPCLQQLIYVLRAEQFSIGSQLPVTTFHNVEAALSYARSQLHF